MRNYFRAQPGLLEERKSSDLEHTKLSQTDGQQNNPLKWNRKDDN